MSPEERLAVLENITSTLQHENDLFRAYIKEHMEREDKRWQTIEERLNILDANWVKLRTWTGAAFFIVSGIWAFIVAAVGIFDKFGNAS